jgi:hypothetical protein
VRRFHIYALAMVLLAGVHWGITVVVQPRFELEQVGRPPLPPLPAMRD